MFPYSAYASSAATFELCTDARRTTGASTGAWQMTVYTSIEMAGRSSTGEQLSIVIQTYFSKKSSLNEAFETSLSVHQCP